MVDTSFVSIQIDDVAPEKHVFKQIDEKMKKIGTDKVFYNLDNSMEITLFSKGHTMNTFFNDARIKQIRRKVDRKWVFPVTETNEFLKNGLQNPVCYFKSIYATVLFNLKGLREHGSRKN